ncbi:hypothetical protein JTE90_022371 [Oedothorax gibbosus]|uniref:G-protein coupled receptors family 1 profile domain-containing protein n=1 Tax=Oedothorax gibbosus TaxID=931172 RepID=A0AAV6UMM4_9ARAC|nr:hypothetical protein JTE90_022371 [Oedothorax gibbosus]
MSLFPNPFLQFRNLGKTSHSLSQNSTQRNTKNVLGKTQNTHHVFSSLNSQIMTDYDPAELRSVQWPIVGPSVDGYGNISTDNNTVQCTLSVGCFLRYSLLLSTIYCIAYGIVLTVGTVGNVCAFMIVVRDRTLHSVYYKFMANLAIADLLVLMFCLPVTLLGNLFGRKYYLSSTL